ncbi:hypothetical protein [Nannocystis pusilla]
MSPLSAGAIGPGSNAAMRSNSSDVLQKLSANTSRTRSIQRIGTCPS